MMMALMMSFCVANAQLATENSKFFDNVYVGAEVGATTPLDFSPMFPLNTVAGIKVGKELTPVFGLEAEWQLFFNENDLMPWTSTFVKGSNLGVNGVTNLSNLFFGYTGTPRVFEVKANTGLGWLRPWDTKANSLTAKTALDLAFNIGKKRAHTVTVTPGIWWDLHGDGGKIQFNKNFAQFGVFVGYTYHFKTSNGTHHFKVYDVGALNDQIRGLTNELAKKPRVVTREKVVEKVVEKTVTQATGVNETVYFAFDSAELDDRAKETLNALGQNGVYVVDAWASNEGSTEYNLKLSQRRADAVKAYLESRGAKVDSATGHGVQFGTSTGRVAVVKVK